MTQLDSPPAASLLLSLWDRVAHGADAPVRRLQAIDPGFTRLILATKTVIGVAILISIFWHADRGTRLFAGLGAAFVMQCSSGGSRRLKELEMFVSGLAMAGLVALAGVLFGHVLLQHALLMALAAGVYVVRRFIPDRNLFPTFCFTATIVAIGLGTSGPAILHEAFALLCGVPVAVGLAFLIFPARGDWATRDAGMIFRRQVRMLLRSMREPSAPDSSWLPAWLNRYHRSRRRVRVRQSPARYRDLLQNFGDRSAASRRTLYDQYEAIGALLVLDRARAAGDPCHRRPVTNPVGPQVRSLVAAFGGGGAVRDVPEPPPGQSTSPDGGDAVNAFVAAAATHRLGIVAKRLAPRSIRGGAPS